MAYSFSLIKIGKCKWKWSDEYDNDIYKDEQDNIGYKVRMI